MPSPRYLAEHLAMPRFLREQGASAALDAIERGDADFFVPVWSEAGFRFTSRLLHVIRGPLRVGVLSLPMPREATEAYLAAVVGKPSDAAFLRYFLWEKSDSVSDDKPHTMLSEWAGSAHRNFGEGPPFTGDLATDCDKFIDRVVPLCTD